MTLSLISLPTVLHALLTQVGRTGERAGLGQFCEAYLSARGSQFCPCSDADPATDRARSRPAPAPSGERRAAASLWDSAELRLSERHEPPWSAGEPPPPQRRAIWANFYHRAQSRERRRLRKSARVAPSPAPPPPPPPPLCVSVCERLAERTAGGARYRRVIQDRASAGRRRRCRSGEGCDVIGPLHAPALPPPLKPTGVRL